MRTIIALLISASCYGQFSFYIPRTTLHFTVKDDSGYAENQGGDKGIVVSYDYNNVVISVGSIRNSYGDTSKVYSIGGRKFYDRFDLALSIGVADGYDKLYYFQPYLAIPKFMKKNNLAPLILLTTRVKLYKYTGFQLNISPSYINYGFYIKL